ncbi:hypothetical protein CEUSTIGMA_g823.t1 [Chlamydomonas eustigma]|uniref:Uncharacterized protein n=1 Tax=Chlamydomonas eustigma TaxID=1157962 RepID=A0A250WS53_9CHLO|nr:hypothetical protein CEUSTIGMA_g823.t1 [Chlamydomonas eustigma]|eukprot:GAX73370.1 hypothetical protein CEUSTIGMA_g823.t1 [Chlamydomonas eustigma]
MNVTDLSILDLTRSSFVDPFQQENSQSCVRQQQLKALLLTRMNTKAIPPSRRLSLLLLVTLLLVSVTLLCCSSTFTTSTTSLLLLVQTPRITHLFRLEQQMHQRYSTLAVDERGINLETATAAARPSTFLPAYSSSSQRHILISSSNIHETVAKKEDTLHAHGSLSSFLNLEQQDQKKLQLSDEAGASRQHKIRILDSSKDLGVHLIRIPGKICRAKDDDVEDNDDSLTTTSTTTTSLRGKVVGDLAAARRNSPTAVGGTDISSSSSSKNTSLDVLLHVFITFQHYITATANHSQLTGCCSTTKDCDHYTAAKPFSHDLPVSNCSCPQNGGKPSPAESALSSGSSHTIFKGYFFVEALSEPKFTPWGQMSQPAAMTTWSFPVSIKPLTYFMDTAVTSATSRQPSSGDDGNAFADTVTTFSSAHRRTMKTQERTSKPNINPKPLQVDQAPISGVYITTKPSSAHKTAQTPSTAQHIEPASPPTSTRSKHLATTDNEGGSSTNNIPQSRQEQLQQPVPQSHQSDASSTPLPISAAAFIDPLWWFSAYMSSTCAQKRVSTANSSITSSEAGCSVCNRALVSRSRSSKAKLSRKKAVQKTAHHQQLQGQDPKCTDAAAAASHSLKIDSEKLHVPVLFTTKAVAGLVQCIEITVEGWLHTQQVCQHLIPGSPDLLSLANFGSPEATTDRDRNSTPVNINLSGESRSGDSLIKQGANNPYQYHQPDPFLAGTTKSNPQMQPKLLGMLWASSKFASESADIILSTVLGLRLHLQQIWVGLQDLVHLLQLLLSQHRRSADSMMGSQHASKATGGSSTSPPRSNEMGTLGRSTFFNASYRPSLEPGQGPRNSSTTTHYGKHSAAGNKKRVWKVWNVFTPFRSLDSISAYKSALAHNHLWHLKVGFQGSVVYATSLMIHYLSTDAQLVAWTREGTLKILRWDAFSTFSPVHPNQTFYEAPDQILVLNHALLALSNGHVGCDDCCKKHVKASTSCQHIKDGSREKVQEQDSMPVNCMVDSAATKSSKDDDLVLFLADVDEFLVPQEPFSSVQDLLDEGDDPASKCFQKPLSQAGGMSWVSLSMTRRNFQSTLSQHHLIAPHAYSTYAGKSKLLNPSQRLTKKIREVWPLDVATPQDVQASHTSEEKALIDSGGDIGKVPSVVENADEMHGRHPLVDGGDPPQAQVAESHWWQEVKRTHECSPLQTYTMAASKQTHGGKALVRPLPGLLAWHVHHGYTRSSKEMLFMKERCGFVMHAVNLWRRRSNADQFSREFHSLSQRIISNSRKSAELGQRVHNDAQNDERYAIKEISDFIERCIS